MHPIKIKTLVKLCLVALVFVSFFVSCQKADKRNSQMLDAGWQLMSDTLTKPITVTVPGDVHMYLFNNGLIPDPFVGEVDKELQWISDKTWVYKLNFSPSQEIFDKQNIELVFDGIDTYASIYLNDTLLFFADNMFRTWNVDVKDILRKTNNELCVVFYPVDSILNQKIENFGIQLPENRAHTRKAAFQFGWDWSPVYKTIGLWKPVCLNAWSEAKINSVHIYTSQITDNKADMMLDVEIESATSCSMNLEVLNNNKEVIETNLKLNTGNNTFSFPFTINNPKLWYPHELGEQNLYQFEVNLADANKVCDSKTVTTGIREIKLIREKDSIGESFYFQVNGKPLYAKGVNYIPEDNFLSRMNRDRTRKLLRSVTEVNMNMLRVWGGGTYPDNYFFEICDSLGILVWEDFMFANTLYPDYQEFYDNVKIEAVQQIKRIRNHPSLALWCGNNEIDEGYHNWGWQKQFSWTEEQDLRLKKAYDTLFKSILPSLVDTYDKSIDYWPSSPSIGWGRPQSLLSGDAHYWGVWWGEEPFEMYNKKVGRFNSEYGFQAYPDYNTMRKFGDESELKIGSSLIEAHQKHARGTRLIEDFMEKYFCVPTDLEEYVFVSQLSQMYGICIAVDAHRREKPRNMGSLYWQLNDSWPVVSWSSIDYFGRWKALHYNLKRYFSPVLIGMDTIKGSKHAFWIVNELPQTINADLLIDLRSFDGSVLHSISYPVSVESGKVCVLKDLLTDDIIKPLDKNFVFVHLQLCQGDELLSERFKYFVHPKYFMLENPNINITKSVADETVELFVETDVFTKNIQLMCNDVDGHFDKNYFDMVGEKPRKVIFYLSGNVKPEELVFSFRTYNEVSRKANNK